MRRLLLLLLSGVTPLLVVAAPPQWRAEAVGGPQATFRGFHPLLVELQVTEPFQGSLRVRPNNRTGGSVHMPLSVGPGQYRYELPGYPPSFQMGGYTHLEVDLLANGRRVSPTVQLPVGPQSYEGQPNQTWGWVTPRAHFFFGTSVAGLFQISPVAPQQMPRDPWMLECVDTWVIPGSIWPQLDPEQQRALFTYLQRGGRVVTDTAFPLDQDLPAIFQTDRGWRFDPAATNKVLEVQLKARSPMDPSVGGPAAVLKDITSQVHLPDGSIVEVVDKSLNPTVKWRGAQLKAQRVPEHSPWKLSTPVGIGTLSVFGLDLEQFLLDHRGDEEELALEVFLAGVEAYEKATEQLGNYPNWAWYHYGYNNHGAGLLRAWTGLRRIPPMLILFFLAVFCLVATAGERIFLGAKGWLRFTWGSSLLLVALFSISAAMLSHVVRGTHSYQTSVLVRDHAPDGGGTDTGTEHFIPSRFRTYTADAGPDSSWRPAGQAGNWWYASRQGVSDYDIEGSTSRLSTTTAVWADVYYAFRREHTQPPMFELEGDTILSRVPLQHLVTFHNGSVFRWIPDDSGTHWTKSPDPETLPSGQDNQMWEINSLGDRGDDQRIEASELLAKWATAAVVVPDNMDRSLLMMVRQFPGHHALPLIGALSGHDTLLVVGGREREPSSLWNFDRLKKKGLILHRQRLPLPEKDLP